MDIVFVTLPNLTDTAVNYACNIIFQSKVDWILFEGVGFV